MSINVHYHRRAARSRRWLYDCRRGAARLVRACRNFPSPRDDKTLIDIRATISAELTGAARRCVTAGGHAAAGKSIDSTKVYRINSTAHLINNDFRRERSVYKRGHAPVPPPPPRSQRRESSSKSRLQNDGDNIGGGANHPPPPPPPFPSPPRALPQSAVY